jgi:hypothetical protein
MKPAIIGTLVVIFCILPLSGRAQQLSGVFDLATADVTFNGISLDDWSSYSVSSAGDVNGDGLDDILIGAYKGAPNGKSQAGETYLVYGRDGEQPSRVRSLWRAPTSPSTGSTGMIGRVTQYPRRPT